MLNKNYAKQLIPHITFCRKNGIQENEYFNKHSEDYADEIMSIQPTFFKNTSKLINNSTKNSLKVLDIGNGGVINYNFIHFDELICGDLSLSQTAVKRYKEFGNITFVSADILNLCNFADAMFDTVIVQAVIHHLAGSTLKNTHTKIGKAITECLRVLKPGGQLLIVESTVNRTFELIERLFYPLMQLFFKVCKFGSVYQYSDDSLLDKLSELGDIVEYSPINVGPFIWIMGKKIPTRFTPCGALWVKMIKD